MTNELLTSKGEGKIVIFTSLYIYQAHRCWTQLSFIGKLNPYTLTLIGDETRFSTYSRLRQRYNISSLWWDLHFGIIWLCFGIRRNPTKAFAVGHHVQQHVRAALGSDLVQRLKANFDALNSISISVCRDSNRWMCCINSKLSNIYTLW